MDFQNLYKFIYIDIDIKMFHVLLGKDENHGFQRGFVWVSK